MFFLGLAGLTVLSFAVWQHKKSSISGIGRKMDRDLLLTALHVLARFCQGAELPPGDVNALRRHALANEADLPIDELCTHIIERNTNSRRMDFMRG
jgi:hypothetical protein